MAPSYRHITITDSKLAEWAQNLDHGEIEALVPWREANALEIYMAWANTIGWRLVSATVRGPTLIKNDQTWDLILVGESQTDPTPDI